MNMTDCVLFWLTNITAVNAYGKFDEVNIKLTGTRAEYCAPFVNWVNPNSGSPLMYIFLLIRGPVVKPSRLGS